ncbi:MAG: hypothetical protein U1E83_07280 [Methylotetracoccus sp.]
MVIIQHCIKGIGGIDRNVAMSLLASGITCNWWRKVNPLPNREIPVRLNDRNLEWHQNRYIDPDPLEGNEPFGRHTPFISVTAGTVERDAVWRCNLIHPAWQVALEFATDGWSRDGYLFYCYLFILSRPSVHHPGFSEEKRDLNVYTGFSPFQPEGEITAKIIIPPTQIQRFEFFDIAQVRRDFAAGQIPTPRYTEASSDYYQPPEEIANIRTFLV